MVTGPVTAVRALSEGSVTPIARVFLRLPAAALRGVLRWL
jgi:hypothetical protein